MQGPPIGGGLQIPLTDKQRPDNICSRVLFPGRQDGDQGEKEECQNSCWPLLQHCLQHSPNALHEEPNDNIACRAPLGLEVDRVQHKDTCCWLCSTAVYALERQHVNIPKDTHKFSYHTI